MLWMLLLIALTQGEETIAPLKEGLEAVEVPDLSLLEDAVRDHIIQEQNTLREVLARGDELDSSDAYGTMGEVYHAYGFTTQALACYDNAINLDSMRSSSLYLRACIYKDLGRLEESEADFRAFTERRPQYPPGWYQLAELALIGNRLTEAEGYFQKSADLNPNAAAAWAGLGRAALKQEKYEEAIAHLEKALELNPRANRLNFYLANAWRKLGDKEKAVSYMKASGKIGVRLVDPLFGRLKGRTYSARLFIGQDHTAFAAGDYPGAEKNFLKALEINPDHVGALVNLATTQATMGRTDDAIESFKKAIAGQEDNNTAHFNLGLLYYQQGKAEASERHLQRAVEIKGEDLPAQLQLGILLLRLQRYEEALTHFAIVADKDLNNETAQLRRGQLLTQLGRFEEAKKAMQKDCARNPHFGQLTHYYARFLATCPQKDLRDGDAAITMAQSVVNAVPSSRHLETLALAQAQADQCENAVKSQERALHAAFAEQLAEPIKNRLMADLSRYRNGSPCAIP